MKKIIFMVLLLVFIGVACLSLSACIDTYGRPQDYVEVERLTIDSAKVFLSPSGITSTYQLNVNILPENASNTKLDYYIPSEYKQYLKVSDTGLLSATGQLPEDDLVIPVKVTSSTNKNAYLTISVKIEYVSVKEISFDPEQVTLYLSDTFQMNPLFTPYHAQDGRLVEYSSLNEEVATVDSSGLVRPVKAGHTRILCKSSTSSGKTITGRLEVEVVYATGKYRLEVSDSNPQYNQVLGDFKAIHFNLMSLDPNSDPDIRIQWYVDSERVVELGLDSRQYEHIPSVEALTTYRIKVVIDPSKSTSNDAQQVLYSEWISIYARFQGFALDFGNTASDSPLNYRYGDEVTFVLTEGDSSVIGYNWYLKKKNSALEGVLIATTTSMDRNLTRRLNVEGEYILTAKSVGLDGSEGGGKTFDFSVTRLVAGDTVIVNPIVLENGTPPETYNYFLTPCDENGELIGETMAIGHSADKAFCYEINAPGNYIITANATLNGVLATVPVVEDGKTVEREFVFTSDVLRVFSKTIVDEQRQNDLIFDIDNLGVNNTQSVTDVVISGIQKDGQYKVLLSWEAPLAMYTYTVEIKKGEEVTLINHCSSNNNYIIVSPDIVTLEDSFSVRVKADGGLFSNPYYYNQSPKDGFEKYYYKKIAVAEYSYLAPVSENITTYVPNMRFLGELLRYLSDYTPMGIDGIENITESIDGTIYRAMKFKAVFGFDFAEADSYFAGQLPENLPKDLIGIYKALLGAQGVYCAGGQYSFRCEPSDGAYDITMIFAYDKQVLTDEISPMSKYSSVNYSDNPYGQNQSVHVIDGFYPKTVSDSEQLYYAVLNGYKPTFTNDNTRMLYQKAISVINSIIGKDMTDYEKVLAIFDYLTLNVKYDTETATAVTENLHDCYNRAGFKLEGVFNYNKAVCDGISKAFVLLCGIEGITTKRIVGTTNGSAHAWNKVYIDGKYYVVDCTNGVQICDGENLPNYRFFMISDSEYKNILGKVTEYGDNPICKSSNGYYDFEKNGYAVEVNSVEELAQLLNSLQKPQRATVIGIKFSDLNAEELAEAVSMTMLTNCTVKQIIALKNGLAILIIE